MNYRVLCQKKLLQSFGYASRLCTENLQNKLKYPWNGQQQHCLFNYPINERCYSTKEKFDDIYAKTKQKFLCEFWTELFNVSVCANNCKFLTFFLAKKLPQDVDLSGVFACNELDLDEISVYGFDYDYTLACYKQSLHYLLYNLGRDILVQNYKYPKEILNLDYSPGFAVRGLHYDIEKGLLLKLDSFLQIQFGTVYRGLTPVSDAEVLQLYKNRIIPIAYVEGTKGQHEIRGSAKMVQLADLFSVPEMCLLCNVAEFFIQNGKSYHPEILFRDVKKSISASHPIMHSYVTKDVGKYIDTNANLRGYFQKLVNAKKQLFLVTNSPYYFVNKGMEMLAGHDWQQFFDVIIVNARKPRFFTDLSRPIREFDVTTNTHLWDRVVAMEKGKIYYEVGGAAGWWKCKKIKKIISILLGNAETTSRFDEMEWWKRSVLRGPSVQRPCWRYIGARLANWRHYQRTYSKFNAFTFVRLRTNYTFAQHEINTLNNEEFKANANWLQMLTQMIEDHQDNESEAARNAVQAWHDERDALR